MNFELYNYYRPSLIDDTEVLDLALKSKRCFVTLGHGFFIIEFVRDGNEFRYVTRSTERYESICEALRKNGVAIVAGDEAFNIVFGLGVATLFGLLILALIR